jgi:hypothetical protein
MSVVLLAEVKTHLNIPVTTYDTELQTFIDSAEATLTNHVGPLAPTSATDRVAPANGRLRTRIAPVVSLTSVTSAEGQVLTLTDLHLDQRAGAVTTNIVGVGFISAYYDVVYSAGRSSCPEDLKMAVKELVRHLWFSQRGTGARPGSQPDVLPDAAFRLPGASYTLPMRVEQLIAPHLQAGFA